MENSLLSRLAPELRNRIYEEILVDPEGFKLTFPKHAVALHCEPSEHYAARYRYPHNYFMALTATCKEIRKETLPMVYGANKFVLQTVRMDIKRKVTLEYIILGWLSKIGPAAHMLRKIELDTGTWWLNCEVPRDIYDSMLDHKALFAGLKVEVTFIMYLAISKSKTNIGPVCFSLLKGERAYDELSASFTAALAAERASIKQNPRAVRADVLVECGKWEWTFVEHVLRLFRENPGCYRFSK